MKRVLFKIILPAGLLAAWMLTCYPVCNKADGFDVFLYWILVGCPYGLRKMCMILVPKNFGIAGSMGILALNCVVGGLIGGVVAIWRMVTVLAEIIKVIRDYFWTRCPKVHEMTDNKRRCSSSLTTPLIRIRNVFHYILNPAVEYLAKPV